MLLLDESLRIPSTISKSQHTSRSRLQRSLPSMTSNRTLRVASQSRAIAFKRSSMTCQEIRVSRSLVFQKQNAPEGVRSSPSSLHELSTWYAVDQLYHLSSNSSISVIFTEPTISKSTKTNRSWISSLYKISYKSLPGHLMLQEIALTRRCTIRSGMAQPCSSCHLLQTRILTARRL